MSTTQPEQIRPSKLQSIKACPGYKQDKILNPDGTQYQSDAAERGTNLHKWMEDYIASGCKPKGLPLEAEDADAIHFCKEALELTEDIPIDNNEENTSYKCEREIDLTWIGLPELKKGTVDLTLTNHLLHTCLIVDYKFGRIEVSHPKDNMQAKAYVAGMFHEQPQLIEIVFMFIMPFLRKTVSHVFYPEDVADLITDIRTTVMRWRYFKDNVASYRLGDGCVYCSGKPVCPLMQDLAISVGDGPASVKLDILPTDTEAEKLRKYLDSGKMLSEWYDSVRQYALLQMQSGMQIPGYKEMQRKGGEKILSAYMAYKILNTLHQVPVELFLDACTVSFKGIDKALNDAGVITVDAEKVRAEFKDAFIVSEEHVTKYIQKGKK